MTDLVTFVAARLDEWEQAARTCAETYPPPWDLGDRGYVAYVTADGPAYRRVAELAQENAPSLPWLGDALWHVALHDPARVLAQVAAMRAVLAVAPGGDCDTAHPTADIWHGPNAHDSPVVLALAAAWADHPDYPGRTDQ